jgi:hypothetical protein
MGRDGDGDGAVGVESWDLFCRTDERLGNGSVRYIAFYDYCFSCV